MTWISNDEKLIVNIHDFIFEYLHMNFQFQASI